MNQEYLKFDHFKNIDEILEHIDIWYKEDDIDYTRWFHLEDLKKIKDYITNLQQENKQLKEEYKRIEQEDLKAFNNYDSILTELEEWLKEHIEICKHNANIITEGSIEKKRLNYRAIIYEDTLDKIQELKEKYK